MVKKILIFSTAYLPMIGGAEIAVKEIVDQLGADFSFDLICSRIEKKIPAREKIGSVNIFRVGWGWGKIDKLLLPWCGAALAVKLYAKQPYDLIWAIMASFGGLAALRFKLKYPAVPYLLTLQEGDTPEHIASRARWLGPYYKKMFRLADFITTISQYLKDFALAQGARSQIEIVPNGVTLANYELESITNRRKIKDELGIKENEKVIITVSRLVEKNGIGDLIDAINLSLITYHLSLKLLILGTGPLEQELNLILVLSGIIKKIISLNLKKMKKILKNEISKNRLFFLIK